MTKHSVNTDYWVWRLCIMQCLSPGRGKLANKCGKLQKTKRATNTAQVFSCWTTTGYFSCLFSEL